MTSKEQYYHFLAIYNEEDPTEALDVESFHGVSPLEALQIASVNGSLSFGCSYVLLQPTDKVFKLKSDVVAVASSAKKVTKKNHASK